jgi:hypothetical protein
MEVRKSSKLPPGQLVLEGFSMSSKGGTLATPLGDQLGDLVL